MRLTAVWSACWAGKELYVRRDFAGSYYECRKWLRSRRSQGFATHFYAIATTRVRAELALGLSAPRLPAAAGDPRTPFK